MRTREELYRFLDKKSKDQIIKDIKHDEDFKMYCVPPYDTHTWVVDYLADKYDYIYNAKYFKQKYSSRI